MPAATAERLQKTRRGDQLNLPVKAASQLYRGCMVVSLAGVAIAARAAVSRAELSTMMVVGVAEDSALGGAADGDVRVQIRRGVFQFANSAGGDALTEGDVGQPCFAVDDQTVAKTVGGGARAIAGEVVEVDADGVWVDFNKARRPRRLTIPFQANETDVLAGTLQDLVSPVAGAISYLEVVVQKDVTTGGNVTANVGGVAVVGLAAVVANAAVKGTIANDTPTMGDATTVVAEGSRISIVPDAAFATAGDFNGFLEITY
jgi:hypothetical protein